jgi:threonine dehydratase
MRELQEELGYVLVHPFNDWDVIHGAGTAVRELLEDEPDLEVVVTPVGGGGLLSGSAISAKSHNPSIKVIGVEPVEADDPLGVSDDDGRWSPDSRDRRA